MKLHGKFDVYFVYAYIYSYNCCLLDVSLKMIKLMIAKV